VPLYVLILTVLRLLPLQSPVIFSGLELQLAAEQIDLHIGELHQEEVEFVARLQVRALITVFQPPGPGAQPDGAVLQSPAFFAAGALSVGQKPRQSLL
jgi:hypothetical protein